MNRLEIEKWCKCTRCRNIHHHSERIEKRTDKKYLIFAVVCPKCECRSYNEVDEPIKKTN